MGLPSALPQPKSPKFAKPRSALFCKRCFLRIAYHFTGSNHWHLPSLVAIKLIRLRNGTQHYQDFVGLRDRYTQITILLTESKKLQHCE
ncbi:hypothetical protein [Nostoc sp. FACHB-190]|uniref:hypothetical protein n=1 Tax=Nostoc sp. FACHB-190 TaxID=2692838 RepID=UPI001688F2E3|nr:hypothetical protein [Nostoc sp. FACHB-190]MBD2298626.1 hypothetical protein [Nostoc sp. FACHB-190]